MKKLASVVLLAVLLAGCMGKNEALERGMALRARLLSGGCSFDARITADYGDQLYSFQVSCTGDSAGKLSFTVVQPETLAGITGTVAQGTGKLTFTGTALEFPLMADGQVTPVSAPWLLLKTLRGGCITSAGMEGEQVRLTIDDSYEEDALQLDIWLDQEDKPTRAEILYAGRRILTLTIESFTLA